MQRYKMPARYLHDLISGAEMDLTVQTYPTFDRLREYCYRVAGTVGLTCTHVFGFSDARALDLAEKLGLAFQLTNIIRDVHEDHKLGRVYLPEEDLQRYVASPEDFDPNQPTPLIRAYVRLNRGHFLAAAQRPTSCRTASMSTTVSPWLWDAAQISKISTPASVPPAKSSSSTASSFSIRRGAEEKCMPDSCPRRFISPHRSRPLRRWLCWTSFPSRAPCSIFCAPRVSRRICRKTAASPCSNGSAAAAKRNAPSNASGALSSSALSTKNWIAPTRASASTFSGKPSSPIAPAIAWECHLRRSQVFTMDASRKSSAPARKGFSPLPHATLQLALPYSPHSPSQT